MADVASSAPFCTTGGMSHMHDHRQRKLRRLKNDMMPGPAILPDGDANDPGQHQQQQNGDHEMHDHDHMDHMDRTDDGGMHMMGGGTIMYMDGFRWALFPPPSSPPPPCLNLFSPSWTLDTESKFVFAMVFVAAIGALVEACGVWRVKCLRKGRKYARDAKRRRAKQYNLLAASLHASRAALGYLLMLAVMSYAIEFMICAVAGIVIGRYWFVDADGGRGGGVGGGADGGAVGAGGLIGGGRAVGVGVDDSGRQGVGMMDLHRNRHGMDDGRSDDDDALWGGGDPCCGMDDDEADNDDVGLEGSGIREPLFPGGGVTRRAVA